MNLSRRQFLNFLGVSSATAVTVLARPTRVLASSCVGPGASAAHTGFGAIGKSGLIGLPPLIEDRLITADGIACDLIIRYGDTINDDGDQFGFNNDFIAFFAIADGKVLPTGSSAARNALEALLWVNHETPIGLLMHGNPGAPSGGTSKTWEQVREEQLAVGGSIIRIVRDRIGGPWRFGGKHPLNRRVSGRTKIPFVGPGGRQTVVGDANWARGTLANCAGGVTPWGTVLTCEENYHEFYGELPVGFYFDTDGDWRKQAKLPRRHHDWVHQSNHHPWHYGWVVEIDPLTGTARKLVAMGRAARECATVTLASDGRAVVYSGDDHRGGCIFKFISRSPSDLTDGDLYAADVKNGQWILLSWHSNSHLRRKFKDQMHVLLNARAAGLEAGATPMDRPEDVELHPETGDVYIALTNNPDRENYHGSLLRISEKGKDPLALEFDASTWMSGGPDSGFSSPDNLIFDSSGNLLFTTDVSKDKLNKGPYKGLGNNSLFVVSASGPDAGQPVRVASAPVEAEFTGPCLSSDEGTLFLSVQHPGENTQMSNGRPDYSSSWPDGRPGQKPCPALVALRKLPQ